MADSAFTLFRCLFQFPYTRDYKYNKNLAIFSVASLTIFAFCAIIVESLACRELGFQQLIVDQFLGISRCISHILCLVINLYELISKNRRYGKIMAFIRPECHRVNSVIVLLAGMFSLASFYIFQMIPSDRFRLDSRTLLVWSLVHNASLFMNMCVLMQFCIVCDTLRRKLIQIDDHLVENFKAAIVKHSKVVRATKLISELYGPQLIIISLVVFLNTTTYVYYLISTWSKGRLGQIIFNSACVAYYGFQVAKMTWESDRVVQQGRKFYVHLFKVMMNSDEACFNEKIRLYLTMNEQICFTANGFFNVGRPLLTSMVAGATSYVFILINVDK